MKERSGRCMLRCMATIDLKQLGRRLRVIRSDRAIKQTDIAKRLRVSKQLVSHWETGRSELTLTNLIGLAAIFDVSTDAILFEEKNLSKAVISGLSGTPVPLLSKMDLVNRAQNRDNSNNIAHWRNANGPCTADSIAFLIFDRSMQPNFEIGDLVFVDPNVKPEPGDCVAVVLVSDATVAFRRYRPSATGGFVEPPYALHAHNSDYEPLQVTKRHKPTFLGTLTEHVRFGSIG